MTSSARRRMRLSGGTDLSYVTAGDPSHPAVLLLHGFPSSANSFRAVIPALAPVAHVIAPDLPGYGESQALPQASFSALASALTELLERLGAGPRYIYLHDYGAPVGLQIAMQSPEQVLGLIIQNANAHRTGFGPQWRQTLAYWSKPDADNEAAATAHLSFEGVRDQYLAGVPADVAAQISGQPWVADWNVMRAPDNMATQRALVADYGSYVSSFDEIADYLSSRQPPALMIWGRHDAFFSIAETVSWLQALPRMEAHILDGGHFLLETHAEAAATLMLDFLQQSAAARPGHPSR